MAGKNSVQPLAQQHPAGGVQPVQQANRRRVGIGVVGIALGHVVHVKEGARQPGRFGRLHRLGAEPDDAQTGGQHEPLLRSGHRHIDAPVVKPELHRPDRRHTVHEQHRRVARRVQRVAHRSNVRPHAGRGFVVRGQNGLDLVARVGGQNLGVTVRRHALPPRGFDHVHVQPVALAHINPALRKHPVARGQNGVARAERVGQRRFPAPRAGRGEDEHLGAGAFQHLLNARTGGVQDLPEQRRPVVDGRHIASLAQVLGDVGRPRNENWVLKAHVRLLDVL